jgi:hypothetical protein
MKTNTGSIITANNNDIETKEITSKDILKKTSHAHTFGMIDLWRLQKKHKSLGSSTKW